jgi:hypothetical protein
MPFPPWNYVWDALRLQLGPALGVSLLIMLVIRWLGGERLSALAAALAVVGGVFAANWNSDKPMSWQIYEDQELTLRDLGVFLSWSLESKKPPTPGEIETEPAEPPREQPSRYWLPWAALLVLLCELLLRFLRIPTGAAWAVRTLAAVFAARLLIPVAPSRERIDLPWLSWAAGVLILLEWAVLQALARKWKDGTVPLTLALCFLATSVIVYQAAGLSLMQKAQICFAALLGTAVVAWIWPSDTGPALAAAAVFLTGLLLNSEFDNQTQVPLLGFVLAALAPLSLALLLLPFLVRQERWKRWLPGVLLPLIPAGVAVFLTVQVVPLDFSELEAQTQRRHVIDSALARSARASCSRS